MNTDVPPPPPRHHSQAGAGPVEPTRSSGRLANPYALFATTVLVSGMLALAFGVLSGWAVTNAEQNSCSPSDGWCGLGAALAGLFIGGLVGVVTYVATGVTMIVKYRPSRARARHVLAHLTFPIATILVLTTLATILP